MTVRFFTSWFHIEINIQFTYVGVYILYFKTNEMTFQDISELF